MVKTVIYQTLTDILCQFKYWRNLKNIIFVICTCISSVKNIKLKFDHWPLHVTFKHVIKGRYYLLKREEDSIIDSIPSQQNPSPVKPALHTQVNPGSVSVHVAFSWQGIGSSSHSSRSGNNNGYTIMCQVGIWIYISKEM